MAWRGLGVPWDDATVVAHPDVRSLARVTLADFFVILLVALVMLAPLGGAGATATWLIVVAALSGAFVARPAAGGFAPRRARTIGLRLLLARIGLSVLCYLGLAGAGALLAAGDAADALGALLVVVVLLLTVAVRNTWDLLVTVADRPGPHR